MGMTLLNLAIQQVHGASSNSIFFLFFFLFFFLLHDSISVLVLRRQINNDGSYRKLTGHNLHGYVSATTIY